MAQVEKSITLFFREGSSDKEYRVQIEEAVGGTFAVNAYYGRRGSTLKVAGQGSGFTREQAEKVFVSTVNKKTAKGYAPSEDAPAPVVASVTLKTDTGLRPQLLNPITQEEAQQYLFDDAYGMQLKYDGVRLLVRKVGDEVVAANRKGQAVTIPANLMRDLQAIPHDYEIDGELVEGVYFVFDMFSRNGEQLAHYSYADRWFMLRFLVSATTSSTIVLSSLYTSTGSKRQAYKEALEMNREGVVFKRLDARYSPGRPARGGSQVKCKFWSSASCIVAGYHPVKSSIEVELLDTSGARVPMGSVTLNPPRNDLKPGDVVEIRYLYVGAEGGRLYQPTFLGKREDIDPAECTLDQIKYTGRVGV